MTRYIATIKNQYDNKMKVIQWNKTVANNFINVIKNPIIVESKDKIPQWKICSVKGEKRCTENMDSTDVLILDYDSNMYSIETFMNRFREYRYILHTSYSYNGLNQKFRVFLFMNKEYEINKLFFKGSVKQYSPYFYLIDYFEHIDPSFAVRAQFFKVPAISRAGAPYVYHINNGKLFNPFQEIDFFETAYEECEMRQINYLRDLESEWEKSRKNYDTGDLSKAKAYVEKQIEAAEPGTRHNLIFSLSCWWKHIGGSFAEFEQILPSWSDKEYNNQINHLRKEWCKLR